MDPAALTSAEAELENLIFQSGHSCAECGENLHLTSDAVLVQVVYGHIDEQNVLTFRPMMNGEGEFGYEPYFFDETCWESVVERLQEHLEEEEEYGIPVPADYAIKTCEMCESDIPPWEPCAMASFGRLHRPKQTPNGESAVTFDTRGLAQRFYCISCTRILNDEALEMWEHFSYHGECEEGTYRRCWRNGLCEGGCTHRMG